MFPTSSLANDNFLVSSLLVISADFFAQSPVINFDLTFLPQLIITIHRKKNHCERFNESQSWLFALFLCIPKPFLARLHAHSISC